MNRRSVHDIIEDWRAAERDLPTDGSAPDSGLLARIEALRMEHLAAMAAELDDREAPAGFRVEVGERS